MKRILAFFAAGLAGAVMTLLALSIATGALAQEPTGQPTPPAPDTVMPGSGFMGRGQMMNNTQMGRGQMMGRGGQMGGSAQSLVGMAAAKLGLSQAELITKMGATGTIAGALQDGSIDPAAFIDEFVASRATRLNAAVAAGRITQAQADERLATVRAMATTHVYQTFSTIEHSGRGQGGQGSGPGFVDVDGDGVCDNMPAGTGAGAGHRGGGRGPRP